MVIDVSKEDVCLILNQDRIPSSQATDHLSQGPYGFPKENQLPLQLVNCLECFGVRLGDNFFFQGLNLLCNLFQYDKIVVHDGIDQGIEKIIGPPLSDAPFAFSKPLSNLIEDISDLLLE